MSVVDAISQRSTCNRGRPGCVFVKDNQILSTGYAGSPPGFPHCGEEGHYIETHIQKMSPLNLEEYVGDVLISVKKENISWHCIRTIHAEQNAILQAAKRGVSLQGSTVYVSMTPCRTCAMMLISVGVAEVIAGKMYQKAQESIDMFAYANIPLYHLDTDVQKY